MGKKNEHGLDFSFKYLQKRNIRKEKQEEYSHPHQLAIARWLGSIHHSFGGSLSLDPLSHSQIQRQGYSPASFPITRKDATPAHTRYQQKNPIPPTPLSLKRGNSQISKTVLSTAAMPHQP